MGLTERDFLSQRLDQADLENLRRPAGATRDDLLKVTHFVESEARHLNLASLIIRAVMTRAAILRDAKRLDEAVAVLEMARHELRQNSGAGDQRVFLLVRLAEAHALREDWWACSTVCDEGIRLTEEFRGGDDHPRSSDDAIFLKSAYLRFRIGLYAYGALAAYHLGDVPLLLQRTELSKCHPTLPCDEPTGGAPEFSLQALKAMLDADEAILYYYWVDNRRLLIVTIDWERAIPELRSISDKWRERLEESARSILTYSVQDSNLDEVRKFSEVLLPAEAAERLRDKRRLLFCPHRLLHAIPFHVLRWEGDFLIRRFAVAYTPNLGNLLCRYTPSQPRVLAIGIKDYNVPGKNALPPLPNAEQEVADLRPLYEERGIEVVMPPDAQESGAWLRQMAQEGKLEAFSCLHFAMHGKNVDSNAPLDSHLFLRDSPLSGREIARWRLQADLVVLSACSSGQRSFIGRGTRELPGEELAGDDLFGLHADFFEAGARRILSCLWSVDDAVAPRITLAFHRGIVAGEPPETALQTAVKEYLKTADELDYAWAPFFLSLRGRPATRSATGGE